MRCAARSRMYPATYDFLLKAYEPVKAGQARLVRRDRRLHRPERAGRDRAAAESRPRWSSSPPRRSRTTEEEGDEEADGGRGSRRYRSGSGRGGRALRFDRQRLQRTCSARSRRLGAKDPKTLQACARSWRTSSWSCKLSPRMFDALILNLRTHIAEVRQLEKEIMVIAVRDAGMPRKDFIASFPKNETNPRWLHASTSRAARSTPPRSRSSRTRSSGARRSSSSSRSSTTCRSTTSRKSIARSRSARPRRGAPRRRWSRRTCAW